jgi:ABC-type phosphate transport system permease subunit
MLSSVMHSFIVLSFIMLSVNTMSVILLSVVVLSVAAPFLTSLSENVFLSTPSSASQNKLACLSLSKFLGLV